MPYIQRRIQIFLDDLKSGKINVVKNVAEQLNLEIQKIRFNSEGEFYLETCSPFLRAFARTYYIARDSLNQLPNENKAKECINELQSNTIDYKRINELNRELFEFYHEVFSSATDSSPEKFVPKGSDFSMEIKRLGAKLKGNKIKSERAHANYLNALERLDNHYRNSNEERFKAAQNTAGMKLVLGGKQSFSESSLKAVQSMLLYGDSILIPDPVFRWIEGENVNEKFRHVQMLEDIYYLSQLSPIINSDLETPPLIIFPSWEKSLELHDEQTQDGIELLAIQFFSNALNMKFDDLIEIKEYAHSKPDRFLKGIEDNKLFISWGRSINENLNEAIANQRKEYRKWRTKEYVDKIEKISDAELVLISIVERLIPQFHILDNAETFNAFPLMSLKQHWHYYSKTYHLQERRFKDKGILSNKTIQIIKALTDTKSAWLSRVPIDDLVRLRSEMANVDFRKKLNDILIEFETANSENVDSTLASIGLALQKLLEDHNKEVSKIDQEYNKRFLKSFSIPIIGICASFIPYLPDLAFTAATLSTFGKLVKDNIDEFCERRQLNKSLMGVLAASARDDN